ncbi:diacylglycerol kinase family lipid kinase [Nocardia otitidiscaviarum]|uniref:Diacylglycerol kinase family lipid kinase n=1 Tax=Nocardia otitidiscaviarum TaxID=1823 RepID=A0A516NGG8_9NOCA|nr:diacylglycerol kinase family protein [Nocardia otitidiscaviarum]MCP9623387.1 diacylglycerol kinase family lipid kinase [Nocardia otitidiscaviarum]QDP78002.1 diacylglycerol kinase family lipid kinase [Nocardia otitidiscaviarum]
MRTLLIVNPNATSTTPETRDLLAHALESRTQLTVVHTEHRGHAAELAQWAADIEMDLIVVHGGDGTVNETINGFLPLPGAANQRERLPRLGIIPGGSANVFARALGIDPDPVRATNQLIDLLSVDKDRRIGLGVADDRWFIFSAGVGLDADVCEAIDAKRANGHAATPSRYLRTTVKQFFKAKRRDPMVRVAIPGHEPVTEVHYAFVTNASPWTYLDNTPVRTNPGTSFETGLGVFAMRTMGLLPTLRIARQLLAPNGNPKGDKLFRVDDSPSVRVEASEPIGLQIDGDFIGRRNMVNFTAVPDVLEVVAPQP